MLFIIPIILNLGGKIVRNVMAMATGEAAPAVAEVAGNELPEIVKTVQQAVHFFPILLLLLTLFYDPFVIFKLVQKD